MGTLREKYAPNIRLGTHTIKVSFQRWDYKGFVTFRRGGNCKGLDILREALPHWSVDFHDITIDQVSYLADFNVGS